MDVAEPPDRRRRLTASGGPADPVVERSVRVLVLNAGSSSLKASVLEADAAGVVDPRALASAAVELGSDASRAVDATAAVAEALGRLEGAGVGRTGIRIVAHRVVHGGRAFSGPVLVDQTVLAGIEALAPLAPLHNPVAAACIAAAQRLLPDRPHVAVFDTTFHATVPETVWRYPVPDRWTDDWGVRRYGFHGLSVEWSTGRAAELLGRPADSLALVVAHLGNGCSVTAVLHGRSVATSMGMTPLEGLMMGTRAGSIDPGILLLLLRDGYATADGLADALDHRSGLLGVSGTSGDVRSLQEAAEQGDERAALALRMFAERAAAGIAAIATALPRLDGLVLTGGIGEHAGPVRAAITERLGVVGVRPVAVDESGSDRILAPAADGPASAVPVLRIEAREDLVAARAALRLLAARPRTTILRPQA